MGEFIVLLFQLAFVCLVIYVGVWLVMIFVLPFLFVCFAALVVGCEPALAGLLSLLASPFLCRNLLTLSFIRGILHIESERYMIDFISTNIVAIISVVNLIWLCGFLYSFNYWIIVRTDMWDAPKRMDIFLSSVFWPVTLAANLYLKRK